MKRPTITNLTLFIQVSKNVENGIELDLFTVILPKPLPKPI